jgi:uncharacterized repeat protein (TIGR01451 family)
MKMRLLIDRLSGRHSRGAALALTAALVAILLCAAPALANVSWHITMTHANPYGRLGAKDPYTISAKTFARESTGDAYTITVRNEGSEASQPAEPIVVADQLPAGVVLQDALAVSSPKQSGSFPWNNGGNCTIGAETLPGGEEIQAGRFECETSNPVNPGESLPPITAELAVSAQAAPPATNVATLTNTATVKGGGGLPAQTAQPEGETAITPAVPFGIDSFAVHVGEFSKRTRIRGNPEDQGTHRTEERTTARRDELYALQPGWRTPAQPGDRPCVSLCSLRGTARTSGGRIKRGSSGDPRRWSPRPATGGRETKGNRGRSPTRLPRQRVEHAAVPGKRAVRRRLSGGHGCRLDRGRFDLESRAQSFP